MERALWVRASPGKKEARETRSIPGSRPHGMQRECKPNPKIVDEYKNFESLFSTVTIKQLFSIGKSHEEVIGWS